MKEESLIGKKVRGFRFKDGPGYLSNMDRYIGSIGTITRHGENTCSIKFNNGDSWGYPYPEILDYLIEEEEQSIEEILNNIKNLTKDL